jgi:ActR/RegA family two-component response regulator
MAFGALIPGSIRARMDILVLEDDNELAKSFTRCLIDRGFNATFQTSIAEALTYLKMNKPSVIISDFNLGSGETAFDFILKIPLVNIGPEIPRFYQHWVQVGS